VWIPSPNFTSGRPSSRILCCHTSEGSQSFRSLGNFLSQSSSQVSYHAGFDDTSATQIGEYVKPPNTSWSAMAANSYAEHGCCCTPSGASSGWSRQTWLGHDTMLRACGAWIGEEAARYQVPIVKIGADDIVAGRSGVCGHGDVSAAGAGGSHTDPGPAFPWDVVLAYALGGKPFPEPAGDDLVLIGEEWYPMSIFQSDADARQAAALTWWAQYLSRTPDVANLASWADRILNEGYAGALNSFLHMPEVETRLANRPW
jgi:hypothetical protein